MGESVVLDSKDMPPSAFKGRRHKLGPKRRDFKTIFSIRARHNAHINLKEAVALNLGIEWVLRCKGRRGKRVVFLLDSKVVIGGAAKGRSNSKPLLRELRRTAALLLAGSIQPYFVYIGTKDNPADAPSRGAHRAKREGIFLKSYRHRKAEEARQLRRLVEGAGSKYSLFA